MKSDRPKKQKSSTLVSSEIISKADGELLLSSLEELRKNKPSTSFAFPSQIPVGEDGKLSINSLPPEVLVEILMKLPPLDLKKVLLTNKSFYQAGLDNVLWERKFKLYFPHIYEKMHDSNNVEDWYQRFWHAYKEEYSHLEKPIRPFFSRVKEGDIKALTPSEVYARNFLGFHFGPISRPIRLTDLYAKDKNGLTLIDLAKNNNDQAMLDYFYKSIVLPYYSDKDRINTTKLDEAKRNIFNWAITLNQSDDHNLKRLVDQAIKNNSFVLEAPNPLHDLLQFAAQSGRLESVKYLIEKGVNPNLFEGTDTPLFFAAEKGHLKVVKYLIEKGAEIDKVNQLPHASNVTPFWIAAQNGHVEILKYLGERGADVNKPSSNQSTPLFMAAKNGHVEIVKYLIEKKSDVNARGWMNATPLCIAAQNGHSEIVKDLIEHGASIQVQNKNNSSPLSLAAQNGHFEIVKYLVAKGANVNAPGTQNATPLNIAAYQGHIEIVKHLLAHGAQVDIPAEDGSVPLLNAAQKGHTEIVRHLIENGADVNKLAEHNLSALFEAAQKGHLRVVKLLIENGADFNIALIKKISEFAAFKEELRDNPEALQRLNHFLAEETRKQEGGSIGMRSADKFPIKMTPLQIAEIMGHKDIVNYLEAHMKSESKMVKR